MKLQHQSRLSASGRILQSLRSGSTVLFAGTMLGNVVAYAYHMFMARMMTPADYGILVTLTSISYVLAVLMRTFQAWVIKAVSATRTAGNGQARGVFVVAMRVFVPLGAAAFVGHWLISRWVADFLHLRDATPVILLGLYTFSSFVIPIPRGMLLGLNRLYLASVIHILEPTTRLVAGIGLVLWGLKVNGALTGYAAGNLVAFTIALIPLWPLLRSRQDPAEPAVGLEGLDRYALLVLAVNTCLMIMASVDQIAVKRFFSGEVAGNYAVAFLLGRVIAMSTIALGWVIFARSSTMPPDDPQQTRLLTRGLMVIGAIALALTGGYLAAPGLAVRVMGGSQYSIAQTYIGLVGVEMTLFAFVYIQAYYHISIRKMEVVWPLGLAVILEIALLARYHATVEQVLLSLIAVMCGLLLCVSWFSWALIRDSKRPVPVPIQTRADTG